MRPELLLDACGRPNRFFTPFSIEQKLSEADGKKKQKNKKTKKQNNFDNSIISNSTIYI
jgi:hypothetical protein